jgi:hypothetical protein
MLTLPLQLPDIARIDQSGHWAAWIFQKLLSDDKIFSWIGGGSFPTFENMTIDEDYEHFSKTFTDILKGASFLKWLDG